MTNSLIAVSAELAALVAVPGALYLLTLAARSPRAPGWLDTEAGVQVLGFLLAGAVAFFVAAAVVGLLDLGIGIGRSVGIVAGLLVASTILVCLVAAAAARRGRRAATIPSAAVPQA
jgi:hypothetical protein